MAQTVYDYPDISVADIPIWMERAKTIRKLGGNFAPHFHGCPGSGKTANVEQTARQWAANDNLYFHRDDDGPLETPWEETFGFVNLRTALMDSADIKGYGHLNEGARTTDFFTPERLPVVEKHGKFGVLFLDDIADASAATIRALNSLLEAGRIEGYVLPEGWIVILASNQKEWKTGSTKGPSHSNNRGNHFNVIPDADATAAWMVANGYNAIVAAFLKRFPEMIFVFEKDVTAFPSARTWVGAAMMVDMIDDPDDRIVGVSSFVGKAAAIQLDGFMRLVASGGEMPTYKQIISNPTGAPAPTAGSEMVTALTFAIVGVIKRKVTCRDEMPAIITYISRLERDFQATLMHDLANRPDADALFQCVQVAEWKTTNPDVRLAA